MTIREWLLLARSALELGYTETAIKYINEALSIMEDSK